MKKSRMLAACAVLGLALSAGPAEEAHAYSKDATVEVSYYCKADPQDMMKNAVRVPVKTGDETRTDQWLIIGAASGLCILFLAGKRKKQKEENRALKE